jgi:hypothetical protein
MAKLEIGTDDLTRRQVMARHMLERASTLQIYLGIGSTVAAASLIGCAVWLLV